MAALGIQLSTTPWSAIAADEGGDHELQGRRGRGRRRCAASRRRRARRATGPCWSPCRWRPVAVERGGPLEAVVARARPARSRTATCCRWGRRRTRASTCASNWARSCRRSGSRLGLNAPPSRAPTWSALTSRRIDDGQRRAGCRTTIRRASPARTPRRRSASRCGARARALPPQPGVGLGALENAADRCSAPPSAAARTAGADAVGVDLLAVRHLGVDAAGDPLLVLRRRDRSARRSGTPGSPRWRRDGWGGDRARCATSRASASASVFPGSTCDAGAELRRRRPRGQQQQPRRRDRQPRGARMARR